jgi:hypothetical protein
MVKENMDTWVREHSFNGPSPFAFDKLKSNETQLFYNIDEDAWLVIDNSNMVELVKNLYGIYYIVLTRELITYLKRN